MSFSTLPPEILLLIARQLETEKDISSLMGTSARNYQLLFSFLYEHNVQFYSGSALISCVGDDYETGVRLLLEFGADAREINGVYDTDSKLLPETPVGPLHFAKSVAMAKLLLEDGADVDHSPSQWGTPLHAAAERGDIEVAKFLVENGADVDNSNVRVATALHIAVDQGDLDMATLLLDYGADIDCDLDMATLLLDYRADIDSSDITASWEICDYFGTPLHFACLRSNETGISMIQLLLERGADLEAMDIHSATPLHIAAAECSLSIVKLLLDHDAPVNIRDEVGITPLFRAVEQPDPCTIFPDPIERPDLDIAKLLLDHGASINIQDNMGITPLFRAVDHSDSSIAKLLLNHGARISAEPGEEDFRSPLHHAVAFGVLDTVELLIRHGAEVNKQDDNGRTCLHLVVDNIQPAILKLLLDHGALANMQNIKGSTALHDVVARKSLATADLRLIGQGVSLIPEDESRHIRCELVWRRDDLVSAKLLIDHGASLDILDTRGKSALDYAAENEKYFVPSLFVGQHPSCDDQPK
ncbi:hypothetical protein V499_08082 [Pseudogymnoascus sp. VKM F-103]|nr:hypothetical protein V499_08082 [Pseudogymnoascus sp. VKM F-103]